jgi:hypothetical protein
MDIKAARRAFLLAVIAAMIVLVPGILIYYLAPGASPLADGLGGALTDMVDPLVLYMVFTLLAIWLVLPALVSAYVYESQKPKESYGKIYSLSAVSTLIVSSLYILLSGQLTPFCLGGWFMASLLAGALGPAAAFMKRNYRK